MSVPALRNWNSADFSYPTIIANPRNLDELIEVVRDHDKYWELGATSLTTLLPFNRFNYVLDKLTAAGFLSLNIGGGFRAHRDDSMVNFKFKRWYVADFTVWAMPIRTALRSILQKFAPAYVRFCKEFERRTGFRMSLLSEVYFLGRDDHSLLSYAPDQDIFTCDRINTNPTPAALRPALDRVQQALQRVRGGFRGQAALRSIEF